ncbi:DNA adenine methylase [Nocardioides sp. 616]|uniref:DNA adenine methylase n=1 Tax=Nocardioides sp. 616 TaxID=2268090 RepID=UPI001F05DCAB|nr:DNA adenine methylase [Nocardioides sp. 616]
MAEARSRYVSASHDFADQIVREDAALAMGARSTHELILEAVHPGNSEDAVARSRRAAAAENYQLVAIYFSSGYFSTRQSVALDCIRDVLDEWYPSVASDSGPWSQGSPRDLFLAAWLTTASITINSPGHTAQFLSARTETGYVRVRRNWMRDVFDVYEQVLLSTVSLGRSAWRRGNRVMQSDAMSIPNPAHFGWNANTVLYADPPYTKDHYSRFYHVLETMTAYDYPNSFGVGRVRSDRHLSDFCYRSRVSEAFASLGRLAASSGSELLVSYPSDGLISETELDETLGVHGGLKRFARLDRSHSTMGGSKGSQRKSTVENLYLLQPQ